MHTHAHTHTHTHTHTGSDTQSHTQTEVLRDTDWHTHIGSLTHAGAHTHRHRFSHTGSPTPTGAESLSHTHTQTHGAHDLPGPERAYSCTLTVCPPWTEPHPSCAGQASPPTKQPPEGTPSAPLDNGAEAWAGGAPGPLSHTRAEQKFGGRPASTAGTQSCLRRGAPAITPPVTLRTTGEPTCLRPKPHLNEAGPAEGPAQTLTLIVASVVKYGSRLPGMALSRARPPHDPGTPTRRTRHAHPADPARGAHGPQQAVQRCTSSGLQSP